MTIMKVMASHNRDLPCEVSHAVRDDAARDASKKIDRANFLEEEIAAFAKDRKKEIKECRDEAKKLAHVSATGNRICPVKVEEVWDIQRHEKFFRRTDLMEVLDKPVALTEAERRKISQMEIDYETSGGDETADDSAPAQPSKETSEDEGDASAASPDDDSDKPAEDAPKAAADAAPANDTGAAAPKGKKGKRGPRVKL